MTVYKNSRYEKSKIVQEEDGERWLTNPPDIDPKDFDDNRLHIVEPGENLWNIAYHELGDAKYYWVIAEMNDIINPFEKLEAGEELILPSRDTLHGDIL